MERYLQYMVPKEFKVSHITDDGVVVIDPPSPPRFISGERAGSDGETKEMLEVVEILAMFGIPCCMVGVAALKYFGAGRVRTEWEISVPTEQHPKAFEILTSEPYDQVYELCTPKPVQRFSLRHTFPLFKLKGILIWFYIVPADAYHLDCVPSNMEYSRNGLPYPKLDVIAQSILARHDLVSLEDLVDGMDLTEEWGLGHLDLSGTNDTAWAEKQNEMIISSVPPEEDDFMLWLSYGSFSCKETWEDLVRNKERRMGEEHPKEIYATRFCLRPLGDPRLRDRSYV